MWKNGQNPAKILRKLIWSYVMAEYIKTKGSEKMHRENNYELSWSERWDIIEEMTCNMSEDEREEWIESME